LTLPQGVQQGDVLTLLDFMFPDGSVAPSKYFVVMGCHRGSVVGFLTTSVEKGRRDRTEGCNPGRGYYPWNFYFRTKSAPFKDGTWVILEPQTITVTSLATRLASNKAFWSCSLGDQQLRAIRNCFNNSPEWFDACDEFMYPAPNVSRK
jgi:hypothetical protein